ncbi:tail assembly chaperone [Listeria booriae]|uniref:Uncharacterized protein n=1 Tax=Listeria booriae TaxID=1552123 RepID=A0A7X0YK17_9LIST|nr:tail assembly chaperone [Listeria booriae]MBC1290633.1 hypothetical protein [Listeria booriae]MBC2115682.1 hypothetical protein [Listeria booriae]MBC2163416.1 hypothetical protein [Listeria booriae]
MITLKIKGTDHELKFNLKALFKANQDFSTKDDEGDSLGNGGSQLYIQLGLGNDEALANVIRVTAKGKFSEDDILDAIENYIEEEGITYDEFFELFKREMEQSRFFSKKITDLKKTLEKQKITLSNKDTDEAKEQLQGVEHILSLMPQEKSLSLAPDTE